MAALRPVVAAVAIFALLGLTAATQTDLTTPKKTEILQSVTTLLTKEAYVPGVDFTKLNAFLTSEKQEIADAKNDDQFRDAVNAALHQFGFSHIVLLTPQVAQQRIDNKTVGIGITATFDTDGIVVVRVVHDAPAEKAGLTIGDVIVLVNGKKPKAITDMLGKENEKVTIKVKRASGSFKTFTIVRKKFSTIRPETLTKIDDTTDMLSIYTFDLSYNPERVDKLMQEAASAKNLILDLRWNGGGAVFNLTHLLSYFLPSDTPIGTFISKRVVDSYVETQHGSPNDLQAIASWATNKLRVPKLGHEPFKGRIAVLVNGGTGSASEMVAAALRESAHAQIVGTKSAGAVLVSIITDLPYRYQLQFPVTDFVTTSGVRLEGTGVTPDVKALDIRVPRPGAKDPPLDAAVALLEKSPGGTR